MWGHGQSGREPKEWAWWLWRDVSDQFSILVHFLPCAVVLWLAGHYDFSFTATFLLCGGYLAHVSEICGLTSCDSSLLLSASAVAQGGGTRSS